MGLWERRPRYDASFLLPLPLGEGGGEGTRCIACGKTVRLDAPTPALPQMGRELAAERAYMPT